MGGKTQKTQNFEAALAELEKVVADMESGQLTLDDALAAYRRGSELLQFCRQRLDEAQQQVQILENGAFRSFEAEDEAGRDR